MSTNENQQAIADVQQMVDRLRTFPGATDDEHPTASVVRNAIHRVQVLLEVLQGAALDLAGCYCAGGCGASLAEVGAHCLPVTLYDDEPRAPWLDAAHQHPFADNAEPVACEMMCITCYIENGGE